MNQRGVFWIVEGTLLAFPFDETATGGVANSGKTFNHKLLWEQVKPCNKPYNSYPRGRVEYPPKGNAVVYMNPHVEEKYIDEIRTAFGITTEPELRYDHSSHYKCFLDED